MDCPRPYDPGTISPAAQGRFAPGCCWYGSSHPRRHLLQPWAPILRDPVRYGDEIVLTDRENASTLQPAAVSVPISTDEDRHTSLTMAHMPLHPLTRASQRHPGNVFAAQFPELPFASVPAGPGHQRRALSGCQICLRRKEEPL